VLAKRRTELPRLERAALPVTRASAKTSADSRTKGTAAPQRVSAGNAKQGFPATVEDALAAAIDHDFDEQRVGRLVLHLGQQEHGDEKAGIFAALVVRAQREQQQGSLAPPHVYRTNGRQ
jgi:hypothetical protein